MNTSTAIDGLRKSLEESPMSRGQVIAVALLVLLAGVDGYDVQSMSFVAPVVSRAWSIDRATLGLVLASSLLGMAAGSLGLSPLADVFGRRPMVLSGIILMTLGSLLSALSHAVLELAASRAVTGLGIGVLVPLTNAMVSEFTNVRRRGFAVAATTVGFSLGGAAGGLIAAYILTAHSWLWVFAFGAAAGAVLLASTAVGLPESPFFLIDRRPAAALPKLNRVLLRIGRLPIVELPPPIDHQRASYRGLFIPGMVGVTIRFAFVYMLVVTAAFYLLSWLPQLVADAGFAPSTASLVSAASTFVGVAAALIFGALAARIGPRRLASGTMIGFGAALAILGFVPPALAPLMIAACACGFFLSATTAVFYTTMTASFPSLMRVSGIGFVMGLGRLVSGLGPYLGGVLFAAGLTRSTVSLFFAAMAAAGGLLLVSGNRK